MISKFLNQRGLSLVELLATLALMSIITVLAFSVLMNGIRASDNIKKEVALRNEADYLMTSFIRDLYTTKESEISATRLPEKDTTNFYLQSVTGKKTGFINNKIIIANITQQISDPQIILMPSEIKKIDTDGQYEITLKLKMTGDRPKEMNFVNVVRTIDDIKKKEEDEL